MPIQKQDLQSLYNAYILFQNWPKMSAAQKARGVAGLGIQGFKWGSGKDLNAEWISKPSGTNPGLTYGQAFDLFNQGYNAYALAKNWDQLNTIQKITGGARSAYDIARTAKGFGLLGTGTNGAATAANAAQLAKAGWTPVAGKGVGAITANVGATLPQGYTSIATEGGKVVAVPAANVPTGTPGFAIGAPSYAGYAGAAFEGLNMANTLSSGQLRDEEVATYVQGHTALAVADVWTGGLASSAYALASNWGPTAKIIDRLHTLDAKINPITRIANMFASDEWKTERNRLNALKEKGTFIPENLLAGLETIKRGRSKEELVARAKASGGNVQFAESRLESDLTPQDIVGYATFAEKDPDWFNKPLEERLQVADQALKAGAVREHHGTVDVDWGKLEGGAQVQGGTRPLPGLPAGVQEPEERTPLRPLKGMDGGSQMVAGLGAMSAQNPYVASALMGYSASEGLLAPSTPEDRQSVLDFMKQRKYVGEDDSYTLPNGKKVTISNLMYYEPNKPGSWNKGLSAIAGMSGVTLTQLLAGGKNPALSQVGQGIGMAALTDLNADEQMNPRNFSAMQQNLRAIYAQAGLKSKDDGYQLANLMYAQERINDTDLMRMQRNLDMVFNPNGHFVAEHLASGFERGVQVAQEDAGLEIQNAPSNVTPVSQGPVNSMILKSKEDVVQRNRMRYGTNSPVSSMLGAMA